MKTASTTAGSIPADYFCSFEIDCHASLSSTQLLPAMGNVLWDEEQFAKVYMGWDEHHLFFRFDVVVENITCYPNHEQGDAVELFIDTKNLKNSRFSHKFCHHFYFLPEPVEGIQGREITRFRQEGHPLCDPKNLFPHVEITKTGYSLSIALGENVLTGFQPLETRACGFEYRVLRSQNPSMQHFTLSSAHCAIGRYPHMWATIRLTP